MRMQFFGDSYDVVKRFLIHTVAPDAKWTVFPMFTHEVAAADIFAFEAFLGVSVASPHAMTSSTDRASHLSVLADHRHIFLDPDIGIKLKPSNGSDAVKYVFGPELVALCEQSPDRLLLVFELILSLSMPLCFLAGRSSTSAGVTTIRTTSGVV